MNGFESIQVKFKHTEHIPSPFANTREVPFVDSYLTVLKSIKANKLVASIPLRLWFSPAYRSKTDSFDRHYHEFEDWQFDWLVEKAGWKITRRAKWTSHPSNPFGFRPILRYFTPRYYIIEAVRDNK